MIALRALAAPATFIALLVSVQPAAAADVTTIGCIEARLGPAAMTRIGGRLIAAIDAGGSYDGALDLDRDALTAARDGCRADNRWTERATALADSFTQARAARIGADSVLRTDGFDPLVLAAAFATLAPADRHSLTGSDRMTDAVLAKIATLVSAPPVTPATRDAAIRHIVTLFASLSGIEYYPQDFTAA
ncbi:hypothetical protein [uncultured Sphingomonas sp.]|uniref:hypothetical protein n=1 Tax=uncultured Sphingomonas sp. TaxID=158754 RepID=UPI0035CB215B